jgi:hypothetical protein
MKRIAHIFFKSEQTAAVARSNCLLNAIINCGKIECFCSCACASLSPGSSAQR